MKKQLSIATFAATLVALLLPALGCSPEKGATSQEGKKIVKIAYLPITHALPVFEVKEELEASNDELQVELVKYGSWPELLDALNTGRVDGASVLIELAMRAKEQGVGLSVVALGHKDGNVVVAAKEIGSAKELKGKRFAIPHRQSSHNILLNDALETVGLTVADVEVVEMAPPEMPSALASGQIAGYCVAEPFGAKAVTIGVGKALLTSEELWSDSLCCGLALNDGFIAERPEDAAKFVRSYKAAGKNLDKARAKEIAKTYLQQDDETLDVSLQWISYDDLDVTPEIYADLVERVKKYGLSENPPAYEEFVKADL